VYFLRQKGLPLPRAAGLAALGLLGGTIVGTAAQGACPVLRVWASRAGIDDAFSPRRADCAACRCARAGALHVDIVPLGFLSSPAVLVSEFALAGVFLSTVFLL
jgi:hypothetical protein